MRSHSPRQRRKFLLRHENEVRRRNGGSRGRSGRSQWAGRRRAVPGNSDVVAMKPALHILTGPTAVGKTEWALRWAEQNNAEIVSCDSLLFYRGMDIGTAKPTAVERARVPHHLIDICAIAERMDVTQYVARVHAVVAGIQARGRNILVAGGSGFYLKSFFAPVADEIAISPALRLQVSQLSSSAAVEELRRLNPGGLGTLDIANPRRVTRALERCLASGRALEDLTRDFAQQAPPFAGFQTRIVRLERAPEALREIIDRRVRAMLDDGLVEEVVRLRQEGLEENPSAARAIGYREVLALLEGKIAASALAGEIAKNTRALVRKQRTWFRTQLPAHRVVAVEALQEPAELFEAVAGE